MFLYVSTVQDLFLDEGLKNITFWLKIPSFVTTDTPGKCPNVLQKIPFFCCHKSVCKKSHHVSKLPKRHYLA